jgi:uncharacterized membrane protein YvlD (DUF360 family)
VVLVLCTYWHTHVYVHAARDQFRKDTRRLRRLLSLPITLMTFGLFALVVNGLLLAITAGLSDYLDVGGFLQTVLAAFLISVLSWVTHRL